MREKEHFYLRDEILQPFKTLKDKDIRIWRRGVHRRRALYHCHDNMNISGRKISRIQKYWLRIFLKSMGIARKVSTAMKNITLPANWRLRYFKVKGKSILIDKIRNDAIYKFNCRRDFSV